jgi:hypothetical protein
LCCCWLFTGAAGFIASIRFGDGQLGRPRDQIDRQLRTHLDGLLGLGRNGLSGLGGGFHLGVLCEDIYEVGREGYRLLERLGALIRDNKRGKGLLRHRGADG